MIVALALDSGIRYYYSSKYELRKDMGIVVNAGKGISIKEQGQLSYRRRAFAWDEANGEPPRLQYVLRLWQDVLHFEKMYGMLLVDAPTQIRNRFLVVTRAYLFMHFALNGGQKNGV
jgi:hypothetical protein